MILRRKHGAWGLWCQRGAFSPFMFGLVMGVTIFSALSMQWAKKELERYQAKQADAAQRQAQDVAKAMEFAILTEGQDNYSEEYTLQRARQFSSAAAKTRGEQDFLLATKRERDSERFGRNDEKIAIAASDDTLLRSQVYRSGDVAELDKLRTNKASGVVVYDTSEARDRQIRTSIQRQEALAEQIYAFYAAEMKFPTLAEFTEMRRKFGLRDVWGDDFEYGVDPDLQQGFLSFTTPWGYVHEINLSLKEGAE
ncbi:MAG: hypothetical protein EBQ80_04430 [Proteobacteria bacterium]|nr:hypothetical protein [Pseudomonadota bacterium]